MTADWDRLEVKELRRRQSGEKWTRYPGDIGAYVAEMDFGTAPEVETALRDAIDRHAFGYLPEPLCAELGAATEELYRERWGWAPPAEWIRPVADVIKAAEIAIKLFSEPDSAVILPTPNYMPFVKLPAELGRKLIEVPMRRGAGQGDEPGLSGGTGPWELDLAAIERAFQAGGRTLILCNPANPLGRVFRREELEALAEIVERNGGRVFADEIHAAIVYGDRGRGHIPYASLGPVTAGHTLTAFSASKAWNVPGLKCAQLLFSNPADVDIWDERGGFLGYGASTLGVAANIAAFREGGEWLDRVLDYLDGNRRRFAEMLAESAPSIEHLMPEGTYLAWLDLRRHATTVENRSGGLADRFRRETGVAMTDGADCGQAGRGFLRFNFALPRPILEEAVQRIAAGVGEAQLFK